MPVLPNRPCALRWCCITFSGIIASEGMPHQKRNEPAEKAASCCLVPSVAGLQVSERPVPDSEATAKINSPILLTISHDHPAAESSLYNLESLCAMESASSALFSLSLISSITSISKGLLDCRNDRKSSGLMCSA